MDVAESAELSGAMTGHPTAEECRAALSRVTESDVFRPAPRLTAFLRFVVEAVLSGRSDALKAYTIAVEALGRPEDFNPVTDAIVRVEAGRLRLALTRYYADEGIGEAVVIALPRGCYVPEFGWRQTIAAPHVAEAVSGRLSLTSVRQRHSALHAEHREERQALLRNMEVLRVKLRAFQSAATTIAGEGTPAARKKTSSTGQK